MCYLNTQTSWMVLTEVQYYKHGCPNVNLAIKQHFIMLPNLSTRLVEWVHFYIFILVKNHVRRELYTGRPLILY